MSEFAELCMRVNAKAVALKQFSIDTPWLRGFAYSRIVVQRYIRSSLTLLDTVWYRSLALPIFLYCIHGVCSLDMCAGVGVL